jgi:hypothetical protein
VKRRPKTVSLQKSTFIKRRLLTGKEKKHSLLFLCAQAQSSSIAEAPYWRQAMLIYSLENAYKALRQANAYIQPHAATFAYIQPIYMLIYSLDNALRQANAYIQP